MTSTPSVIMEVGVGGQTEPGLDWIARSWPVFDAMDAHEREPTTESASALSTALAAMVQDGGIAVALVWAQLLAEIATDGAASVFEGITAPFRRDLAIELIEAADADKDTQLAVLNRIADLDAEQMFQLVLCLGDLTRCYVVGRCGGFQHLVAVMAACEQAGRHAAELQPAVMSCAITVAAASCGDHEVGMRAAEVGVRRAGFAAPLTVMWLVARSASHGRGMRMLIADEHGVPESIIDGAAGETGGDQRVRALCLRLLRADPRDPAVPGLFDEIAALPSGDQMLLLWSTAMAVGSLVAPPPAED